MASKRHRGRRRSLVLAAVAGLLALWSVSPLAAPLNRLAVDLALPAARRIGPAARPSRVALVLIDETTHATGPFDQTPEVAWTPYLAKVLEAVGAAGPQVIGVDLIYPKTLSTPDLVPGFDRPFLAALARLGRTGRLLLAEATLSDHSIRPYPGQSIAVGGPANIRSVHLIPDPDDVVRRQPAYLRRADGRQEPTFAVELARRAGAAAPRGDFLIDFHSDPARFPAYRLSDLYRCAEAGDAGAFSPFAGKVVLVGVALDVEDRRLAADRFAARKAPPVLASPCGAGPVKSEPVRPSTPGVMIAARAVDTLLSGAPPRHAPGPAMFALAALVLFGFGRVALQVAPVLGAALLAGLGALAFCGGAAALAHGLVTPWPAWIAASAVMLSASHGYGVLVEGAARRRITHAFRHYLSPVVVERLADHPEEVKLGGELRWASVMFADLEGFTPLASSRPPEDVVAYLNSLFGVVGVEVEAQGGYVDKFMGDGVMAVWGAPEADPHPEAAAARAALACVAATTALPGAPRLRIGLASGEVIAGNVGSHRRFDYTVIGEAVNRAARLEELCKRHSADILMDGAFRARLPDVFLSREVERTTLRGASGEIAVHQLLSYSAKAVQPGGTA